MNELVTSKTSEYFKKSGIIEYPLKGLKILELISKKVKKLGGGLMLIDYGYANFQGTDTLQSLKLHKITN